MKARIIIALALLALPMFGAQARIRTIKLEDCGNGHFAWAVVSDENRPDGRFTICDIVNCDGSITNYQMGFGVNCSIGLIPPGSPVDSALAWLPLSGATISQIGMLPTGAQVDSIDIGPQTPTSAGYTEYARLLTSSGVEICRLNRASGESPTSTCADQLE